MNDRTKARTAKELRQLTPAQRMARFYKLQQESLNRMSEEGRQRFERRNRRKRRIHRDGY
ncbi:MAG: hypothetical protein H8E44_37255 [Planctomycetes bacterium]|nr:hypothetical protein [Planctomycetota bacterium]MBL7040939.1 hypothetical protein [Pirellulaceae bacterium]